MLTAPRRRARAVLWAGAILAIAAVGWVATQCSPIGGAPQPPRLVVLFAPCTVNASYLAPYRDDVFYTPHLRRFTEDALTFERNQSESDQSGTSYAALLTGRQATGHEVFSHPVTLREDLTTLSEAFAEAGWDTYFWADHGMASPGLHYTQGVAAAHTFRRPLSGDDPKLQEILDRLARDPGYRAFIVTNFTVTHYPYKNRIAELRSAFPAATAELARGLTDDAIARRTWAYQFSLALQKDLPGVRAREALSDADVAELARVVELLYVSNVAHLDALFGGVIDAVDRRGLGPRSLIAFTADHGEVLYRDNALFPWSHDFQLAPEVLRTPLLIRGGGVPAGRYAGVTRSIDLYPTLAALAGVPVRDPGVTGVDLSRALRREIEPPDLVAFSHTPKVRSDIVKKGQEQWALFASYFPTTSIDEIWVSLRRHDTVAKLRKRPAGTFAVEVFDLASDPEERRDLHAPSNPEHARLAADLARYKAALIAAHDAAEARAATPEVDSSQHEKLRALGYVE
jgi:arylsulfatase A-like enzyme